MKIVNPLYDIAFKYLMDNEQIAKKILSVIIDKEIISLSSQPQETVVLVKDKKIPVSRFDFKAIILTEKGEHYTTIIEVQKSRSPDPIARFRRYLGNNYIMQQNYTDENGKEQKEHLPIISVYILGYNLGRRKEYDTPGILVNNSVVDIVTKKPIKYKHKFVQLLTHPCYILQAGRLKKERKTRLEKMLRLFDQSYRTDDKYILEVDNLNEEFTGIANYLARPTQDPEFVRSLLYEEDYEKGIQELQREKKEFLKREKELQKEKEEALKRERELQKEKEEALKRERELQNEKEQADKSLKKMILFMYETGKSISEIAGIIGKTKAEINKIADL